MAFLRLDLPYNCTAFTGERAPWIGGDLQTMRNTLLQTHPPLLAGQDSDDDDFIIPLPDGDALLAAHHKVDHQTCRGLIVIIHGLAGDYNSSYVRHLAKAGQIAGYDVIRVNLRGAGKGQTLALSSYHAGRADDLLVISQFLAKRYPQHPQYFCAFSLGGTMAVNLVSRLAIPEQLSALISFCAPLDMVASAKRFHAPRNRLYNRHFTKSLIAQTLQRYQRAPSILPPGLSLSRLQKIKTVREFDDLFTSQIAGYRDADDYYRGTTPLGALAHIPCPTLLVHSDNDPLIPDEAYRKIKQHDNLFCVITRGGGHVGFHGRNQAFDCWQTEVALQFFGTIKLH